MHGLAGIYNVKFSCRMTPLGLDKFEPNYATTWQGDIALGLTPCKMVTLVHSVHVKDKVVCYPCICFRSHVLGLSWCPVVSGRTMLNVFLPCWPPRLPCRSILSSPSVPLYSCGAVSHVLAWRAVP